MSNRQPEFRVPKATEVRAGMAVKYRNGEWFVWSPAGPERGTAWLIRYPEEGKPETVAAKINELLIRNRISAGRSQ